MTRVMHFDKLELRLDRSTIRKLPGGAVEVDGIAARTGLYEYTDENGDPFIELVPASTLFDQASMDSMAGSSFTIRHPDGLVSPANFQAVTHGAVVKAWQHSDTELGVRVRIGSEAGLKALADGMVELSPGYEVDVSAEPGRSQFGRHDGVQRDRAYNHLSGLWAGEARGGPGMRLHVDGRPCAPAGCRVQSTRVRRADAAPEPRATPKRKPMTKLKITHDGKSAVLDMARWGWVRSVQADAVETGKVTIEIEGEEPSELILPTSMIDMLLEGIGASSAPAAATEPAGMEEPDVQAEGLDADPRSDARLFTRDQIEAIVAGQVQSIRERDRRADARAADARGYASKLLPPGYDYSADGWHQMAVDALAVTGPQAGKAAAKLALDAKADAFSAGRLLERLALASARATHSDGSSRWVDGKEIEPPAPAQRADARAPWESGIPNKPQAAEGNN